MSTYTDKNITKLIINKLTRAQYNSLVEQDLINEDELYFITDDAESEIVTNKVTTLSSSSTDTQYPSAKAVYDKLETKVDKVTGKGLSTNDFTNEEKTKLAGIESGAQVNTVTGVKGDAEADYRTGNINITKANIGLGNVDNTSDDAKPVSTAQQEALKLKEDKSNKVTSWSDTPDNIKYPGEKLVKDALDLINQALNLINSKIPVQASSSNQLADKDYVNSSIATNTATFKGTYNNVNELPLTNVDNNDYAFVVSVDVLGNKSYNRYKYTEGSGWGFEYTLNNSSFTAEQWATINSGMTLALKNQITTNQQDIANIKNGTNIDSFADVEGALETKVNNSEFNVISLSGESGTITQEQYDSITMKTVVSYGIEDTPIILQNYGFVGDAWLFQFYYGHVAQYGQTYVLVSIYSNLSWHGSFYSEQTLSKTEIKELLAAKQDAISTKNNLDADLIKNGTVNKVYTYTEKAKLADIEAGAQVNTVTGVKGAEEGSYRTGEINITPANLGISATSASVTVGGITFNKYTHPTTTAVAAGLYKIGKDAQGHVVIGDSFTLPAVSSGVLTTSLKPTPTRYMFKPKTWNGFSGEPVHSVYGRSVWTDGENIYYSTYYYHFILDKATSTWSRKTWTGLSGFFEGEAVWTDGENIYYSAYNTHYVLDKSTSTWSTKTWTGLTQFGGDDIWTDGNDIYYSSSGSNYVLDVATSTWTAKTWTGLTDFEGKNIWTDGDNIYYSSSGSNYILDKATSTWTVKTWNGLTDFNGENVWTYENNIYYSSSSSHYVLDKSTSTWITKTWTGLTNFDGVNIWTDGENVYYNHMSGDSYVLVDSAVHKCGPKI